MKKILQITAIVTLLSAHSGYADWRSWFGFNKPSVEWHPVPTKVYSSPDIRTIEDGDTFLHILARENLTTEEFFSRLQEFSDNRHGAIPNPFLLNREGLAAKQLAQKTNNQPIVDILTGIEFGYSQKTINKKVEKE